MAFEERRLRDLAEADIRRIIAAGVAEHLYLEYKAESYGENHAGRKELLLDVCMFANAQGGLLLIGISEQRDLEGRPTGAPDPNAELGITLENPELLLQSYDARIISSIEERTAVESRAIPIEGGRYVLALRVPDSIRKPHCVRLEGHVYFPSRRERHRYFMDVREIKDLTMRVASQLDRTQILAGASLDRAEHVDEPSLVVTVVPVFFKDFLINLKSDALHEAFANFHMSQRSIMRVMPQFTFDGLQRTSPGRKATLGRNGVITLTASLRASAVNDSLYSFYVVAFDALLRIFLIRAQSLYSAGAIPSPALLAARISTPVRLAAMYTDGVIEDIVAAAGSHPFPVLQIENMFERVEKLIRPLCDVAHQMFGSRESPCFTAEGNWNGPPL